MFNQTRSKSNTVYAAKNSSFNPGGIRKSDLARKLLFADFKFERIDEERGNYDSFKRPRPSKMNEMTGNQIIDMKIQDLEFKIMTKKRKDKMKNFNSSRDDNYYD